MKTIILATLNKGKEEEIRKLFEGLSIELKGLRHFPEIPETKETGATLEANALLKARTIHQRLRLPVISDDTGLEVFALGKQPGVYSARYAGENVSYADNNRKLLSEMKKFKGNDRAAQFRTVAAFVSDQVEHIVEGVCKGEILEKQRGTAGFGYDPLFRPEGSQKTFAELSTEEKNVLSHRGKAFLAMKDFLLNVVLQNGNN